MQQASIIKSDSIILNNNIIDIKKKIVIHQPMFLPYTGIISKINDGDVFVFLDDVQFEDGEFQHRNRILTKNGIMWFTVPLQSPRYKMKIRDIKITYTKQWRENLLKTIQYVYGKAPYFKEVFDIMREILSEQHTYLVDLNIASTLKILEYLGIKKEVKLSSEIKGKPEDRIDRIINIVDSLNGNTYISGDGAKVYMDSVRFEAKNINVEFQNYKCKEYKQLWSDVFVPYMSILDYMMYMGSDTSKL